MWGARQNGVGVMIGKSVDGGCGVRLDGGERVEESLRSVMLWDGMGGVARRSWARNPNARATSEAVNQQHADGYHITLPHLTDTQLIKDIVNTALNKKK